MTPKTCSLDDCSKPLHASGLCNTHYKQYQKQYQKQYRTQHLRPFVGVCSLEDCSTPAHSKGLCGSHYSKQRYASMFSGSKTTCSLGDCSMLSVVGGMGFCKEHYRTSMGSTEEKRAIIRKAKDIPCTDCGKRYPYYVMDLDHLDPATKKFNLSNAVSYRLVEVKAELKNVEPVCANCHRERTWGGRANTDLRALA